MSSRSHCRTRSCGRSRRLPGSITGRSSGRFSRTRASSRSRSGSSSSRSSRWRSGPRATTSRSRATRTRRSGLTSPRAAARPSSARARSSTRPRRSSSGTRRQIIRELSVRDREGLQRRSRGAARGDGPGAVRRGGLQRGVDPRGRAGRHAPPPVAQERGARVPRVDPRRRRRRARAARVRGRGLQDPERVDDPDAAGRRPHLRQQVHLRPRHPVHALAAAGRACRPRAATSSSTRSRRTRAGLHQAGDRRARRRARGEERTPVAQRLGGAPLLRRRLLVQRREHRQRVRLRRSATRAISSSSTSGTSRT